MDYNEDMWNKSHSGRFSHIHTYSRTIEHIPTCSGIIRHIQELFRYFKTFRTLCNHCILRTFVYLKPEVYSEPSQRSKMNHFVKIVNSYNYLHKLKLLLRYHFLTYWTLWNESDGFFNTDLILNPEVFLLMQKSMGREGQGPWILV